ncbi:MAG: DUF2933 domain-containing protein [Chloroflexota bacterium]|nr:DUF2933 domain-containing protein [Chloroflexota bacterium]
MMNLRLNWKLIAGLAVVVVGLWVAVPSFGTFAGSAAPFLLVLACPLMMLFMHGGHGGHAGHDAQSETQGASCHAAGGGEPVEAPSREARLEELRRQQRKLELDIAALASDIRRSENAAGPAIAAPGKNGTAAAQTGAGSRLAH